MSKNKIPLIILMGAATILGGCSANNVDIVDTDESLIIEVVENESLSTEIDVSVSTTSPEIIEDVVIDDVLVDKESIVEEETTKDDSAFDDESDTALPDDNTTIEVPTESDTTETVPSPVPEESIPTVEETVPEVDDVKPIEPEITFSVVDETVYAIYDVNIRTGPGTENEKIGSLKVTESIQRIGIGDNGWSKVIYNNSEAYIHSSYLSTNQPVKEEPKPIVKLTPSGPYAISDYSIYNEYETQIIKTVLSKINENKNNLDIHEENIDFDQDISYDSYYKVASFFYVYYGQERAVDETFDFVRTSGTDENGNRKCYIRLRYDDIRQFESDMSAVRSKVDSILCGFEDGNEEYILKQISEYLRQNITYTSGKSSLQNALLEGQSVCNGYALAFNMLANRAGIRSDLCIGKASNGEPHAWNRVTLSDGRQYFYDITWYDGNSGPNNKYIHSSANFHGSYLINDYNGC